MELENRRYLSHLLSDLGVKNTVINRSLPPFYGGLFKIMVTIPLNEDTGCSNKQFRF